MSVVSREGLIVTCPYLGGMSTISPFSASTSATSSWFFSGEENVQSPHSLRTVPCIQFPLNFQDGNALLFSRTLRQYLPEELP